VSELINIGPINAGSMNAGAGLDFEGWTCPLPLRDSPNIVMGHGGGGQMSAELIDHLFIPALGGQGGAQADSAVFELGGVRLAFSTDTFVVRPSMIWP
jgi:hydrogenase expression/formation protein HypE